jgi:hypothetical protein
MRGDRTISQELFEEHNGVFAICSIREHPTLTNVLRSYLHFLR